MSKSWKLQNIIAAVILVAILILGAWGISGYNENKKSVSGESAVASQTPAAEKVVSYEGQDGKTAMELLKASHQVTTQQSSFGEFVESIDGTKNTESTYWMFYVDGKYSNMGADQYKTKNGEKIEWRFETF